MREIFTLLIIACSLACGRPQPSAAGDGDLGAPVVVLAASGSADSPLTGPDRENFVRSAIANCSATMRKHHPEVAAPKAKTFCACLAGKEADVTTPADIAYIGANHALSPQYQQRVDPLNEACKAEAAAAAQPAPAVAGTPLAGEARANFIRNALTSCQTSMPRAHPEMGAAAVNIFCNCLAIKEADVMTTADAAYVEAHHEASPDYMQRVEPLIPVCRQVANAAKGAQPGPTAAAAPPTAASGLVGTDRDTFVQQYTSGCLGNIKKENPEVPAATAKAFCDCMANKGAGVMSPADVRYLMTHDAATPEQHKRMEHFAPGCKSAALAGAAAPQPQPASQGLAGADREAYVQQYLTGCTASMQNDNPGVMEEVAKTFCGCLASKGADITTPAEFAGIKAHGATPAQRQRMVPFAPACRELALQGAAARNPPPAR